MNKNFKGSNKNLIKSRLLMKKERGSLKMKKDYRQKNKKDNNNFMLFK